MPWQGSTRRARLPRDWAALRAATLARYPVCTCPGCRHHEGPCKARSTQADHVVPGDDHTRLTGLCGPCHGVKSAREGNAAQARARAATRRQPPAHPGLV